jgi:hypothetical protein
MMMKKMMAVCLLTATGICAKAQFYVQGGVNLANITNSKSGETEKNNMLTTFNAGILGRGNLSDVFALETGLLLDGRGAKANTYFTGSTDDNYVKSKFNPMYLEVPLNLVFKIPLESNSNIFLNAGPYAAMGIAGKSKLETRIFGATTNSEKNIKFSNDDPSTTQQEDAGYNKLKRFDYGVNVGGGVDLGKILLKVNYGMGFAKINSTETDNSANDKNKFRTMSLSLGIPLTGR